MDHADNWPGAWRAGANAENNKARACWWRLACAPPPPPRENVSLTRDEPLPHWMAAPRKERPPVHTLRRGGTYPQEAGIVFRCPRPLLLHRLDFRISNELMTLSEERARARHESIIVIIRIINMEARSKKTRDVHQGRERVQVSPGAAEALAKLSTVGATRPATRHSVSASASV